MTQSTDKSTYTNHRMVRLQLNHHTNGTLAQPTTLNQEPTARVDWGKSTKKILPNSGETKPLTAASNSARTWTVNRWKQEKAYLRWNDTSEWRELIFKHEVKPPSMNILLTWHFYHFQNFGRLCMNTPENFEKERHWGHKRNRVRSEFNLHLEPWTDNAKMLFESALAGFTLSFH